MAFIAGVISSFFHVHGGIVMDDGPTDCMFGESKSRSDKITWALHTLYYSHP